MTKTENNKTKGGNIKRWFWVHRWSSLICTLFLLMLCLTGLPLIFEQEINDRLNPPPPYEVLPAGMPMANLDKMVELSKRRYPRDIVSSVFIDDDEPRILVSMMPSMDADFKTRHSLWFDARTGKLMRDELPVGQQKQTFIGLMFSLHTDLFMDLPGELFLGFMALLFLAALISGLILYGPFMKKQKFGVIRQGRSRRLKWLDLHNLLGIVTLAWTLVVGGTGLINELATPLFGLWQMTDVKDMLRHYEGQPLPKQRELGSVQAAFDTTKRALPGMTVTSIVYPGNKFGSPYHYLLWAKGDQPLTSRLFSPTLVDARSNKLVAVVEMPWYLRALEVCRPLHFGDYGGMPLKVIWALFDVAAIVVLISGLCLWWLRRKSKDSFYSRILQNETADGTQE
ncbi:MAG: PepSY-associated TM helix domain-containing protein [Puia sp.]|nr:PepSY-associated TM helix domain-containing protein [Puia sp.]